MFYNNGSSILSSSSSDSDYCDCRDVDKLDKILEIKLDNWI